MEPPYKGVSGSAGAGAMIGAMVFSRRPTNLRANIVSWGLWTGLVGVAHYTRRMVGTVSLSTKNDTSVGVACL